MSRFIAFFLSLSFMLQTAAFAVNPEEAGANTIEAQIAIKNEIKKINARYAKLTPVKKLKLLNRQEKRLLKMKKKISNMSDKKFDRLINRLDKIEVEEDLREASAEEVEVFNIHNASAGAVDEAMLQNSLRDVKRTNLLNRVEESLDIIGKEKLHVAGFITKTDNSKEVSRSIASEYSTCEKLGFAFLIAGVATFIVALVVIVVTAGVGGLGLLIMGGTGLLMGTLTLVQCENYDTNYW